MSGSIRRTEVPSCRFIASRQSPSPLAPPDGTARRASDAGQSEPGIFFRLVRGGYSARFLNWFRHPTHSYLISLERKARGGSAEERFP